MMDRATWKNWLYLTIVILSAVIIETNCSLQKPNASRFRRYALDELLRTQQLQTKSPSKPHNDQRFQERVNDDKIIFDRGTVFTTKPSVFTNDRLNDYSANDRSDHEYSSKANGEYEFSVSLRNGMKHAERGEFEERNGRRIFVIRGFFQHIVNDSVRVTAYISDDTGYHEVPLPPTGPDTGTGIVDYGPIDSGSKCDLSKGEYCIDQKLLNLMVG